MTDRKPYPADETIDPVLLNSLFEAVTPQTPPAGLRDKILARVRASSQQDFLTVRTGDAGWKTLAPGIDFKMLLFDESAGMKSFLLRAQPGSAMPAHGHRMHEECFVVQGEFRLGDLHLRAGDFHFAAQDALHGDAYTETGVMVYLRASIQDYPGIEP